ncbi:MAG: glycosyltransferase family 4 protein, partial [Bacteroidota bacterium]
CTGFCKSMEQKKITYCLVNNLGGITTMLQNVIRYGGKESMAQEAVLLNIKENKAAAITGDFCEGLHTTTFNFSNKENWYHVFKKLADIAGASPGLLVTNDVYDMLMLTYYNIPKRVVQMVHDGYNVQLAVLYNDVVDAFICHSYFFYETMCQLFPARRNDIYFLPYGVPVSGYKRQPAKNDMPLKLFFLGRHDKQKGIFNLLEIENHLSKSGVPADWLILGRGPETAALKKQWEGKNNVAFNTPSTNDDVLKAISQRDVLVFPTTFEGFPVALAEAMSVGCVPVASNLPGGLREVVKDGDNGFLCDADNVVAFAEKIKWLHHNRQQLENMSSNAASLIAGKYNVLHQSPKYQQLFASLALAKGTPRHHSVKRKLGSRLDQPWLPAAVTKVLRGK